MNFNRKSLLSGCLFRFLHYLCGHMNQGYTLHLPQFEGPFDLLLFFIERDELDIHDIPISKITDDFLAYIREMETLNIDLASEFILVAATLCRIKASLLLPRKPVDEEGNEIDPRDEFVSRLLEYKRYKSVLEEMRQMEEERAARSLRGNISQELKSIAERALVDSELESMTLFKLLRTFERLLDRFETQPKTIHEIVQFSFSVEEQQQHILALVARDKRVGFAAIFDVCTNRIHAIITFLGLLELVNMQHIRLLTGTEVNHLWVEAYEETNEHEEE